jgi:glycosyltransferase 2 family protein
MNRSRRGQIIRALLGLAITVGFLWLVLRRIDLGRVVVTMTQVRWYVVPVGLLFLAAGYAMRIVRWWSMLRVGAPDTKLSSCVRPLLVSVAVNNIAPLRIGDAVRIVGFRQQLRAPAMQIAATLFIERILDTTVLLGFLIAGTTGLQGAAGSQLYTRTAWIIGGGLVFVWAALFLFSNGIERLLRRACRHRVLAARGWGEVLDRHMAQLFNTLNIVRVPGRALRLLLMSVAVWGFEGALFQTVAAGLSYDGHWYGPWFAFATGTFSTLIPSSPGYVGTFDFFAMSGLMAYGAGRSLAAAFAFLVHATLWLPITAAGLVYMLLPTSRNDRQHVAAALSRSEDAT